MLSEAFFLFTLSKQSNQYKQAKLEIPALQELSLDCQLPAAEAGSTSYHSTLLTLVKRDCIKNSIIEVVFGQYVQRSASIVL